MRICILCEDRHVNEVRKSTMSNFSDSEVSENNNIMGIRLSPTGYLPQTHWFCFLSVKEETFQKIKSVQNLTKIEESNPREFLEKFGLKLVKPNRVNIILRRNSINEQNQEYEVLLIGGEIKKMRSSSIIENIRSGGVWKVNENSFVRILSRLGVEYIASIPNNTSEDNLLSLPRY